MATIGFIGLGIMGKGMARNLLVKGNASLVVWNRSQGASQELIAAFPDKVSMAASAREVVDRCQITFSMLSDMAASEAVIDAPEVGAIHGVSEGKIFVDCSTISVERMVQISENVTSRGKR
jgi:3-hydroxyisobutyrate dehydrogenase-like beta-hydroxyacid dehydrogenase